MAGHRYWRLNVTSVQNGSTTTGDISLRELRLSTVAGGATKATGGTGSADSTAAGTVASVFDGAIGTGTAFKTNTTLPHWVQYDFGAGNAPEIEEVEINTPATSFTSNRIKSFTIQYSDDGAAWTTAYTSTAADESSGAGCIGNASGGDLVIAIPRTPSGSNAKVAKAVAYGVVGVTNKQAAQKVVAYGVVGVNDRQAAQKVTAYAVLDGVAAPLPAPQMFVAT